MSDYNRWEDGAPEVRATTVRVHTAVRKQHKCNLCTHQILIGQKYSRTFSVVDGQPEIRREHVEPRCNFDREG
ncbi:MAG: hypothetical protein AB7L09_21480 [Nitrospira sp.]